MPWTNKNLTVKWEHFVSKLAPAEKETWTAVITGPDAKRAAAEMVATLYDASLDAYLRHDWPQHFGVFRYDHSDLSSHFENRLQQFSHLLGGWPVDQKEAPITYRAYPGEIAANLWGYEFYGRDGRRGLSLGVPLLAPAPSMAMRRGAAMGQAAAEAAPAAVNAVGDVVGDAI